MSPREPVASLHGDIESCPLLSRGLEHGPSDEQRPLDIRVVPGDSIPTLEQGSCREVSCEETVSLLPKEDKGHGVRPVRPDGGDKGQVHAAVGNHGSNAPSAVPPNGVSPAPSTLPDRSGDAAVGRSDVGGPSLLAATGSFHVAAVSVPSSSPEVIRATPSSSSSSDSSEGPRICR